jgi:hypothetical protein
MQKKIKKIRRKKGEEPECQHQWAMVLAKLGAKIIPVSTAKVCLMCGIMKIGTHTIKISKNRLDMGAKPIINVSKVLITTSGRLQVPVGTNLYD